MNHYLTGLLVLSLTAGIWLAARQSASAEKNAPASIRFNRTGGLLIDHKNVNAIDSASPQAVARIKQMSVFFAHASVGTNMVAGLNTLRQENSARYALSARDASQAPPAKTELGVFYHCARGNPGWNEKVRQFEGFVRRGWNSGKTSVVINKFCYIDETAKLEDYTQSMAGLEKTYPDTVFVYVTMPVTTALDAKSEKRRAFNEGLRKWTQENGKVLYDLADIETWSEDGKDCGKLCAEYTYDNGHLNALGQRRASKALYSLLVQLK